MWNILLISRPGDHAEKVAANLSDIDPRVRVIRADDDEHAIDLIQTRVPMAAVVAEPDDPQATFDHIVRIRQRLCGIPLLVETPASHPMVALQAIEVGATDCVKTPVAPWEWERRVHCLIDMQRQRRIISEGLRHGARYMLRNREQNQSPEALNILSRAGIYHDAITGHHERRTARIARLIAEGLGLQAQRCRLIEAAACLHDIGKLAIPDKVLKKAGLFNDEDRRVMRDHTRLGHEILSQGETEALQMGARIALSHHERMDGKGYPAGLAGEQIPFPARIVAVADVFESLTGNRHYRDPLSVEAGLEHLQHHQHSHFDPDCVAALCSQESRLAAEVTPDSAVDRH